MIYLKCFGFEFGFDFDCKVYGQLQEKRHFMQP